MKWFYLLISFLLNCGLAANEHMELLIFNSEGRVEVIHENDTLNMPQSEILHEADWLKIIDGSITIINRNNKRITLDKQGSYPYSAIEELMHEAEASLSNRYFVMVWEKMNHGHDEGNQAGGVVRGKYFNCEPIDSVIILSDSIEFWINNNADLENTLFITDSEYKPVKQYKFTDAITIAVSDIRNGKSGWYSWIIKLPFDNGPEQRCFLIPNENTRSNLLNKLERETENFSAFNAEIKSQLIQEYLKSNKVYVK